MISDGEESSNSEGVENKNLVNEISLMNIDQFLEPILTPELISKFINSDQLEILCFPRLTEWLWHTIMNHDKMIAMSPHIIFTLLQEMILTENIEIYDEIKKYSSNFPDYSLDFEPFLFFILESGISTPSITPYAISCCRKSLFYNTEVFDSKKIEISLIKLCLLVLSHFKKELPQQFIDYFNELLETTELPSVVLVTELSDLISNDLKPKCIQNYYNVYHNLDYHSPAGFLIHEWLSRKFIAKVISCEESLSSNDFINNFHLYIDKIKSICKNSQNQSINSAIIASLMIESYAVSLFSHNMYVQDIEKEKLNKFINLIITTFQFNWPGASQIDRHQEREIMKGISKHLLLIIE
ncbi:hypothetical protein TVAG_026440 [Trichomonas vaginalis G3]|uniref:Uncharacterized protein n=1 Tax=Trichomonas vaginalis (strain ATCC PRA-98 / G3) TaxID=412133 RepID=A2DZ47_TRIV3|nr:hypothetical protein TVAGG3_0504930 [Trichomonas vaginalis G3]EAY14323.1 hypothetical protein TVAG_026440 [Trichomonas vaginalis G3]KAI5517350.1 hypothetical protein TVAGG3_0504930 [Trichomonas vaginalis G3]|eukprot:XP_001326546.1 hypothetical protein [Trichomonas vaginalis G3]